jgi:hypothetical protein
VIQLFFLIERRKQNSFAKTKIKVFHLGGAREEVSNFFFLLLVMYIMWQQKERFQVQGE